MSMLAERKRKQKWALNPRGNAWSKDNNKFGQKLLERMGWKEGKGLGAKEDGATEHIRVTYKNDIKGIGFKDSVEWSQQQDNFSALLSELNNNSGTEESHPTGKSLEQKSEKSRARVHYRKFTRGKDLSQYSEKDLANILGRRKLKTNTSQTDPPIESSIEEHTPQFGVSTTTGGSMVDYFKNKLPSFMTIKSNASENESETEMSYGFGFNIQETNQTDQNVGKKKRKLEDDNSKEIPIKKHKSKHIETEISGLINPAFDPLSRTTKLSKSHVLETINEENDISPKMSHKNTHENSYMYQENEIHKGSKLNNVMKKKKSKKDKESGIDNPVFDVDSIVESVVSEESNISKKKKQKKKKSENLGDINIENNSPQLTRNYETDVANDIINPRHRKQSSENLNCVDEFTSCYNNSAFTDIIVNEANDNPFEIKPKKKSKINKTGVENPCFDVEFNECTVTEDHSNIVNDFEVKIKKKRKKRCDEFDNPCFTEPIENATENESDVKVKKKRKRDKASSNEEHNDNSVASVDTSILDKTKSKSKKNKHKFENCEFKDDTNEISSISPDKEINNGIDNPALSLNDSNDVNCDLILNVTDEPVTVESKVTEGKRRNKNSQRKEMCDINTNQARNRKLQGLDNAAFNVNSTSIEESVNFLTRTFENCQAEIENGINENKLQRGFEERMIGGAIDPNGDDEPHPDGVIFKFKNANFSKKLPYWEKQNDVSAVYPKRTYKHLIKGDIVVGFKDTNLHKINGYGKPVKNKLPVV